MNHSDNNLHLVCRLCSSKGNLLSLFNGKNRTIRDYIRKIVAITIGEKYEETDYFDCICYSCVIQTFNIYIFRIKSSMNAERLQCLVSKSEKNSTQAKKLLDIRLPDYENLKSTLGKWICSKFLASESAESDSEKCSLERSVSAKSVESTSTVVMVDERTQTDEPKCFNVLVQTTCKPAISHRHKETQTEQTDSIKKIIIKKTCSQCELLKLKEKSYENKQLQCCLFDLKSEIKKPRKTVNVKSENFVNTKDIDKNKVVDHIHQTQSTIVKPKDRDNGKNKSKNIKNDLKKHNISFKNIDDKIKSLENDKGLQFTDVKNKFKSNNRDGKLKLNQTQFNNSQKVKETDKTKIKNSLPTNSLSNDHVGSDKLQIKKKKYKESSKPERSSNSFEVLFGVEETDNNPPQTKNILQTKESDSPLTGNKRLKSPLSDKESLQKPLTTVDCQKLDLTEQNSTINSVNLETSLTIKSSPGFHENVSSVFCSPRSSKLLELTGKVEYLKTCQVCAAVIHTKAEMVGHKKGHMKCYICKKKFTSIKKTKEHINNDCIRNLFPKNLTISIPKIENCRDLISKYPHVLEYLKSNKR